MHEGRGVHRESESMGACRASWARPSRRQGFLRRSCFLACSQQLSETRRAAADAPPRAQQKGGRMATPWRSLMPGKGSSRTVNTQDAFVTHATVSRRPQGGAARRVGGHHAGIPSAPFRRRYVFGSFVGRQRRQRQGWGWGGRQGRRDGPSSPGHSGSWSNGKCRAPYNCELILIQVKVVVSCSAPSRFFHRGHETWPPAVHAIQQIVPRSFRPSFDTTARSSRWPPQHGPTPRRPSCSSTTVCTG